MGVGTFRGAVSFLSSIGSSVNRYNVKNKNATIGKMLVSPIVAFLLLAFVVPLGGIMLTSFLSRSTYGGIELPATLTNYREVFSAIHIPIFIRTLVVGISASTIAVLIASGIALFIRTRSGPTKTMCLLFVTLPLWTSFLIRTAAWKQILGSNGLLNLLLQQIGMEPVNLLFTPYAIFIGITHIYLPYAILTLVASLERIDMTLLEAAQDLGVSRVKTIIKVLLPLSKRGIIEAWSLVFVLAIGVYIIPDLLGGGKAPMVSNLIVLQFIQVQNWPQGAALATVMFFVVYSFSRIIRREESKGYRLRQAAPVRTDIIFGKTMSRIISCYAYAVYGFLWLPVIIVIIYSFNATEFGMKWEGATLYWYKQLWADEDVWQTLMRSLMIAGITTVIGVSLATIAAYGIQRFPFSRSGAISSFIYTPVMITNLVKSLGLLLIFVNINFSLGYLTIIIGHVVIVSPYMFVLLKTRLESFDINLEEAAADLGARPRAVFRQVTWPLIFTVILSACMLSFMLSFDEFITSFLLAGRGTSTLPMFIYSMAKFGNMPIINALGTIIVVMTGTLAWVTTRLGSRDD